jgi:hypothetical protein
MLWEDRAVRTSPGWINIDKPTDNFSWNYDSSPACDGNCAFRDKVFTVDDWDKLCIQHCGNIDTMLAEVAQRQKRGAAIGAAVTASSSSAAYVSAEDQRELLAAGSRLLRRVEDTDAPRRQSLEESEPAAPNAEGIVHVTSGWDSPPEPKFTRRYKFLVASR